MAIVTTDDKHYKAISEAIREYVVGEQFKPSEMADKIRFAFMCADSVGHNNGFMEGRIQGNEEGFGIGLIEGQLSLLQASKYMNATVSGEVVAVKDVSPIEHDVAVRLSSDTVTDFSSVKVKRYGKNLCKVSGKGTVTHNGITYKNNGDGTITVNGTATADSYYDVVTAGNYPPKLPLNTTLYISGCPSTGSSSTYYIHLPWVGWFDYGKGGTGNISNTALQNNWRQCIRINVKSGTIMDNVVFKPQVELFRFSGFEKYVEFTTHTTNTDGTVEDVRSLSPSMILLSDTDGVRIDCSYLRDIDTYIDSLTGGD